MRIPKLSPELVADLYDSALDEDAWPQFATRISDAIGVEGAAVVLMQDGQVAGLSVTEAMRHGMADYQAYYQHRDPWRPIASRMPANSVLLANEMLPERELLNTEFYNDHARHLGMLRPMNLYMPLTSNMSVALGVEQPFTQHLAENEDKAALSQLAPFVKRALQLRCRLQAENARAHLGLAALQSLAIGLLVCDGAGRIIFANASAEALAQKKAGIILGRADRGLVATVPSQTAELRALINATAKGGPGGALGLTGQDQTDLIVLVTPLPRSLTNGTFNEHVLVALRRAADDPNFSQRILTALFGLSPTQAALAIALHGGQSLEAIAEDRGVRISTARTHLAEIFARTGTENQRDLVRLLSAIPPLRNMPK